MKMNYCSGCGRIDQLDALGKYCPSCNKVYTRAYSKAYNRVKRQQEKDCVKERTTDEVGT